MTDKTTNDDSAAELERLRAHNAELLADLKAARASVKAANDAVEASKAKDAQWRARWHESIMSKTDSEVNALSRVPPKHFYAMLGDMGILKMEPDEDGIDMPAWYDSDGNKINLEEKGGLKKFLAGLTPLDKYSTLGVIADFGPSNGGGAKGSSRGGYYTAPIADKKPADPKVAPALGLR